MIYRIENKNEDTIAMIYLNAHIKRNEFDESYSFMLEYTLSENPFYKPTQQEINSAEFLFSNLTRVVQWDISSVLDIDLSRINEILPIDINIVKIKESEKELCLNVAN